MIKSYLFFILTDHYIAFIPKSRYLGVIFIFKSIFERRLPKIRGKIKQVKKFQCKLITTAFNSV